MKILVILGSPRKKKQLSGNKSLRNRNAKVRWGWGWVYFSKELSLATCIGCHSCLFYGEKKCPLPDDVEEIQNKMLAADGLVFVSPVYVLQVIGL